METAHEDRTRRPKTSPHAVAQWLEDAIVGARKLRPRWGPKKLRTVLMRDNPKTEMPSVSTFALIFKRNGLVVPRRRRRKTAPTASPLSHAKAPNDLWCIDFKGDFAVGKTRCYPLTITDAHSRYLIAVVALRNTRALGARMAMVRVFEQYGLPLAIRSDNGTPFASPAPRGLTELTAWWQKLGIRHERIKPGKPQENGQHERMHRTLKAAIVDAPCNSIRAQQRAFDRFRAEYNDVRPHEALGNSVPAELYCRSRRRMPRSFGNHDFDYDREIFDTARVTDAGTIHWGDQRGIKISDALANQLLGLRWDAPSWIVSFGELQIGTLTRAKDKKLKFVRTGDV